MKVKLFVNDGKVFNSTDSLKNRCNVACISLFYRYYNQFCSSDVSKNHQNKALNRHIVNMISSEIGIVKMMINLQIWLLWSKVYENKSQSITLLIYRSNFAWVILQSHGKSFTFWLCYNQGAFKWQFVAHIMTSKHTYIFAIKKLQSGLQSSFSHHLCCIR